MATHQIQTSQFVYFRYRRENLGESAALKAKVDELVEMLSQPKDVILDLSSLPVISCGEARAFAQLAVTLKGMGKRLRVIPNPQVKRSFVEFQLDKIGSIVLYDNEQAFVREIRKLGGQAA